MSKKLQGGCACGAIRFEIEPKTLFAYNCHCRACQQFTGSAYMSASMIPAENFKLLAGEPKAYTVTADSGGQITRHFCGTCSSPLYASFTRMPDRVAIVAASLDDPATHKPTLDLFVSRAQPWDFMNPALVKFPQGSPRREIPS